MMAGVLRKARLLHCVPPAVWRKDWVVDAQHAGDGARVLEYLARCVFRVAISSSQIDAIGEDGVTLHFRDRASGAMKRCTLPPLTFLARFLQHVLPKGFAKVRSYGLLAPRNCARLEAALAQLATTAEAPRTAGRAKPSPAPTTPARHRCPLCHVGTMRMIRSLPRRRGPPP
ncbi:MAG: transposase [Acidobacteriota bacterium]